jgi:hypothetical protein
LIIEIGNEITIDDADSQALDESYEDFDEDQIDEVMNEINSN